MFKQLTLFVLLISSFLSFAMIYDEDEDGVFYLMGTLTCSSERMVRCVKGMQCCVPLKYDTEIEQKQRSAQETKAQRSCSILSLLHEFIAQHKYSMPQTPFGL